MGSTVLAFVPVVALGATVVALGATVFAFVLVVALGATRAAVGGIVLALGAIVTALGEGLAVAPPRCAKHTLVSKAATTPHRIIFFIRFLR